MGATLQFSCVIVSAVSLGTIHASTSQYVVSVQCTLHTCLDGSMRVSDVARPQPLNINDALFHFRSYAQLHN